ncbi:MAG TPA: hypothetical protein VF411_01935 [Bacteroidia bacterium]
MVTVNTTTNSTPNSILLILAKYPIVTQIINETLFIRIVNNVQIYQKIVLNLAKMGFFVKIPAFSGVILTIITTTVTI